MTPNACLHIGDPSLFIPRCLESRGIVKNAQATAEKAVTTGTDYGAVKGAYSGC